MSNREKCISILDGFSEVQLLSVATILENIKHCMEEAEDDAFCEGLYQSYLADPDKGDAIPIEEFAKELGIEL